MQKKTVPKAKEDLRVIRSRQLIRSAFLQLVEEKGFDDITIQDILDRAQINRSTFYTHYRNKNEVALKLIAEIKDLFRQNFERRFSISTRAFLQTVAPMFARYHDLIRIVGSIRTPKIHLYDDLYGLIRQQHLQRPPAILGKTPEQLDFQAHLFATFSVGVMRYFVEKGSLPEAEQLIGDVAGVCRMLVAGEEI